MPKHDRWALVVLIALALMAGCLGAGDEDASLASEDDAGGGEGNDAGGDPAGETEDERAGERSDEAPEEGESEANATQPEPLDHGIDWTGDIGNGACLPAGPNACTGYAMGGERYHEPALEGTPLATSLTLEWEAISPLTEDLQLTIATVSSCGENCRMLDSVERVEGPAPLTVDVDEFQVGPNATIAFWVNVPSHTPGPVYATAHHEQPFQLTGTLTVQPLVDT